MFGIFNLKVKIKNLFNFNFRGNPDQKLDEKMLDKFTCEGHLEAVMEVKEYMNLIAGGQRDKLKRLPNYDRLSGGLSGGMTLYVMQRGVELRDSKFRRYKKSLQLTRGEENEGEGLDRLG